MWEERFASQDAHAMAWPQSRLPRSGHGTIRYCILSGVRYRDSADKNNRAGIMCELHTGVEASHERAANDESDVKMEHVWKASAL